MIDEIRSLLRAHAALPVDVDGVEMQDDLYRAGMTSHAAVDVMLALEEHFDIEFPDEMLTRASFSSIANILRAVEELVTNGKR